MLALSELQVAYDGVRAVQGLSLTVRSGEIVALLGSNGAGKSSTLKAIVGAVAVHGGTVRLDGEVINGRSPHQLVRQGLSMIPEGGRVFARQSVEQNLRLGAYTQPERSIVEERIDRVFKLFPRLAERRAQLAGTLSGGERQMLAIGRALMAGPRMLLVDEPSLGLAPLLIDVVFEALLDLNRRGVSILLVEQNVRQALRLASRAYVMQSGRLVLSGPSKDIGASEEVRRAYLGL